MSTVVKYATYHTEVCFEIVVPATLAAKKRWNKKEVASVVQFNYDLLDIYQLSQLDTEVAEINDLMETEYTAMDMFENIVTDACENGEVVN